MTDLTQKLRGIANEEFYFGKKGYSPAGKALNESADKIETLLTEGRIIRQAAELVCEQWYGGQLADVAIEELQKIIDSAQVEQK